MNRSSWVIPLVIALLVAGVFFAGCSDESTPAGDTTAPAGTPTVAAPSGPLYTEGDIVKNPSSSLSNGLLIVSYDAASDMYERATVYPNKDGSWGYRIDSKTSKISRANLEKAYTEKVTTVSVSSITIGAPTTVTSAPATTATTVATTATTSAAIAPKIKDISPDSGQTGKKVDIDELEGSNFASGAKVLLKKSGETSISATDVVVESATVISCSFTIPSDAETGYWDVMVTNADGKSDTYETGFTITKGNTTSTTSTTTTTTTSATVTITDVLTQTIVTGGAADYKPVSVLGTNLVAASNMQLTGPGTITASSGTYTSSSTGATAFFNIPAGTTGNYYVTVVDSSGNVLKTSSSTVEIRTS
jgi:hypothetical protein